MTHSRTSDAIAEALTWLPAEPPFDSRDVGPCYSDVAVHEARTLLLEAQASIPSREDVDAVIADAEVWTDGYTEETASGSLKVLIRAVSLLRAATV